MNKMFYPFFFLLGCKWAGAIGHAHCFFVLSTLVGSLTWVIVCKKKKPERERGAH